MTTPSVDTSSTPSTNCSVDTVKCPALPSDMEIDIWFEEDNDIRHYRHYPQHEEKIRAGYANIRKYALQLLSKGFSEEKVYSIIDTDIKTFRVALAKELESRTIYEQTFDGVKNRFDAVVSDLSSTKSSTVFTVLGAAAGAGGGSLYGKEVGRTIQRNIALWTLNRAIAAKEKTVDALLTAKADVEVFENFKNNSEIDAKLFKDVVIRTDKASKALEVAEETKLKAFKKYLGPHRLGKAFGAVGGAAAGAAVGAAAGAIIPLAASVVIGGLVDAGTRLVADKAAELIVDGAEAAYKECAKSDVSPYMIP